LEIRIRIGIKTMPIHNTGLVPRNKHYEQGKMPRAE
jgi:hypothetical protein